MRKFYSTFLLLFCTATASFSQSPEINWQKKIAIDTATNGQDEYGNPVTYTASHGCNFVPAVGGGYIGLVLGSTTGLLVVKLSDNADTVFTKKAVGMGNGMPVVGNLRATPDGGFIFAGNLDENGTLYITLTKVAANGMLEWQEKYRGGGLLLYTEPTSVMVANDGGYFLLTLSEATKGFDKTEDSKGSSDYWLIKTDHTGLIEWDKTIGGSGSDWCYSMVLTTDGGCIIGGTSESPVSGDKTSGLKGDEYTPDFWFVKLDDKGNVQWDKTVGSSTGYETGLRVEATADGGFIAFGMTTGEADGDKTDAAFGDFDTWVIKFDAAANIQWQKTLGGGGAEYPFFITQLTDGSYVLTVQTNSPKSGNITEDHFGNPYDKFDIWVVKLSAAGGILWQKVVGGTNDDNEPYILSAMNDEVLLTSVSYSGISGNRTLENKSSGEWQAGSDIWIVKLGPAELPVTLLSFTGVVKSGNALLQWATATEDNFSHFELEKSSNGQAFSKIASLPAKGNSSSYNYSDNGFTSILTSASGVAYYRLKIVDRDGSFTYSNIVVLSYKSGDILSLSPNPVVGSALLSLRVPVSNKNAVLQVVDASGRMVVGRKLSEGATSLRLNVDMLASGYYTLVYRNGPSVSTIHFVKQ